MIVQLVTKDTFRIEAGIDDTFQLIFEALEIAASSDDVYAPAFGALAEQLALAAGDWM
jgi:hypothetical protein